MRVLVADDDPSLRFLCRVALESEDHEVLLAEDGKQVLDRLRVDAPELVLLDVNMPYVDGMQVLHQLRPDQRESVPFLLLSARSSIADRIRGLELGAVDYITKPFQTAELLAMVSDILHMSSEDRRQHRLAMLEQVRSEQLPSRSADASFAHSERISTDDISVVSDRLRFLDLRSTPEPSAEYRLQRTSGQHLAIARFVERAASGAPPTELYPALAESFVTALSFVRVVVLEIQRGGSGQFTLHACASAGDGAGSYVERGYVHPRVTQSFIEANEDVYIVDKGGIFTDDIAPQRSEVWFAIPGINQLFGMVAVDCAPGNIAYANDMAYVQTMIGVLSLAMRGHRAEDRLISVIRTKEDAPS